MDGPARAIDRPSLEKLSHRPGKIFLGAADRWGCHGALTTSYIVLFRARFLPEPGPLSPWWLEPQRCTKPGSGGRCPT